MYVWKHITDGTFLILLNKYLLKLCIFRLDYTLFVLVFKIGKRLDVALERLVMVEYVVLLFGSLIFTSCVCCHELLIILIHIIIILPICPQLYLGSRVHAECENIFYPTLTYIHIFITMFSLLL